MRLYNLIDFGITCEYSETYRRFTYDMYALCKQHVGRIDFLDEGFDQYCDPMMDYNTPEELAGFALDNIDRFIAVVCNETSFPIKRVNWALKNYYHKMKMYVLIHEDEEERTAPISKDSLKYKLYFKEKMYPQSFFGFDELTFWIAVQIMSWTGLNPELVNVKEGIIYIGDVYIGYASYIPAINRSIEYRNATDRGADPNRVAEDIIRAVVFASKVQAYTHHERFREITEAQMRGDNIGVSLMINHESLNEEIAVAFEKYKTTRWHGDKDEINIILTKMQFGLLNSYIINCADENRDEYAEQLKKDINKHRNHLNKFKTTR